ncbi:type II toxin-antitoxin system RelE/ParE family toxin [Bradyrhizobium sp. DOA9]|uniref:type II toxin-antitoxin system RelE/ParE family toxin n=1 Tax=Bradyrhizobium sp. DOA9 TaxID=1126627 RepID=UPI00046AA247|nr:type II toxin-antitoxin system RelE/ParE family toxin [Bradyrhizobium sp. DOA9]
MARRPLKSPQTEIDLTAIWDYIAADNPRAADALLDHIDATFNMLAETPFAGRERRELRAGLRSFPVGNYLIFYVPTPDGIDVVRVMHGRQDINADDMQ